MLQSVVLVSALVAAATAQSSSSVVVRSTATQEMPTVATQAFNPGLVNRTRALQWCTAQRNTCTDICGGPGRSPVNSCDETTFTYACTCSNGTIPDCTAFAQSLPYYICEETYIQCMANHPSTDPDGQAQCQANRQCGDRNATAERATTPSSSSSASGSATGSSSATGASSTSSQAAAASIAPVSTGAFVALLFAACKLLL